MPQVIGGPDFSPLYGGITSFGEGIAGGVRARTRRKQNLQDVMRERGWHTQDWDRRRREGMEDFGAKLALTGAERGLDTSELERTSPYFNPVAGNPRWQQLERIQQIATKGMDLYGGGAGAPPRGNPALAEGIDASNLLDIVGRPPPEFEVGMREPPQREAQRDEAFVDQMLARDMVPDAVPIPPPPAAARAAYQQGGGGAAPAPTGYGSALPPQPAPFSRQGGILQQLASQALEDRGVASRQREFGNVVQSAQLGGMVAPVMPGQEMAAAQAIEPHLTIPAQQAEPYIRDTGLEWAQLGQRRREFAGQQEADQRRYQMQTAVALNRNFLDAIPEVVRDFKDAAGEWAYTDPQTGREYRGAEALPHIYNDPYVQSLVGSQTYRSMTGRVDPTTGAPQVLNAGNVGQGLGAMTDFYDFANPGGTPNYPVARAPGYQQPAAPPAFPQSFQQAGPGGQQTGYPAPVDDAISSRIADLEQQLVAGGMDPAEAAEVAGQLAAAELDMGTQPMFPAGAARR